MHKVVLKTDAGVWYITDKKPIRFWLIRLIWAVISHRFWHLWHDGKWMD